jgi:hypothetical protein
MTTEAKRKSLRCLRRRSIAILATKIGQASKKEDPSRGCWLESEVLASIASVRMNMTKAM